MGEGIVFYGKDERELVEVIRNAEKQSDHRMDIEMDVQDDDDDDNDNLGDVGTINEAFSRKRGFRKKLRKEAGKEQGR